MEEELFSDITTYLNEDYEPEQDNLLHLLIKNSVREVCNRRYPYGYTDEQKSSVIKQYYNTIFDVAVYLYSKQGAEGQISMSENGTSRSYESGGIPDSYLVSITPIVKIF